MTVGRHSGKPVAQRGRLLAAKVAQGNVGVAVVQRDAVSLRLMRDVARDVSGALPMADDDELGWPVHAPSSARSALTVPPLGDGG